ncbi:MAG TPA: hypothetical protein HPQ04_00960 [Rhodospirillaceae bacterium]|nr:hypothetical protein [Rhodospirillaceae bacterium]
MAESSQTNPLEELLDRLPSGFFDGLNAEQRAQLWEAGHAVTWKRHPVNIRVNLPWLPRRLFVTVVAGSERRAGDRLAIEGRLHRLLRPGNVLFFVGVSTLFLLLAMGALVLLRPLVEF